MTEIKDEERFRTIDDILAFAIKKEEEAAAAYGTMIATARTPGLKKLLGELMDEEENHKKLLAGQEKTHKLRLESEYERHVLGED